MVQDTGEILLAYENAKGGKLMFRRIFPAAFTMTLIILFFIPGYLAIYSARHPVVKYFHGEWYEKWYEKDYILYPIPLLIAVVHFFHVHNGPNWFVTNLSLLIPSMLLLTVGTSLYTSATSNADRLFSTDCSTMWEKSHLQREWEAAHTLYRGCLKETAAARNLTKSYLAEKFNIEDCEEYKTALRKHWHDWSYLKHLEEDHACTGFCKPGEQLWSSGPHKDSCAIAVASVFRNIVQSNCVQVIAISLVTLCLEVAVVIFLGPLWRSASVY